MPQCSSLPEEVSNGCKAALTSKDGRLAENSPFPRILLCLRLRSGPSPTQVWLMAAHLPLLPLESGLMLLQKPPRMQEMAGLCLPSTEAGSEQESVSLSPSSFIECCGGWRESGQPEQTWGGLVTTQSHTQWCQSLGTHGKHLNTQAKQPWL